MYDESQKRFKHALFVKTKAGKNAAVSVNSKSLM